MITLLISAGGERDLFYVLLLLSLGSAPTVLGNRADFSDGNEREEKASLEQKKIS